MQEITLNIDGRQVKGKTGDTVLNVCRANGIDVPTLCHMEGLDDLGACRLCVVDIQGERKPTPSCTYMAREGLVVKTQTPQLEKYRRQMLELIFAERNHFCMFCAQSGDCELQALAYRYQMDNVRFQGLFPELPLETLSKYLVVDHSRCVLCGRCVRICSKIAAIRAIDFGGRGWKTMVTADINQPFGESSCTSCGACLQACPTGAIMSKNALYKVHLSDCQPVDSVCSGCSIGCKIRVMVNDNNMVQIQAPNLTSPKGPLCRIGRFELLNETRTRITSPMIRDANGVLQDCSLDDALQAISHKFAEINGKCDGVISSKCPNDTISKFQKLIAKLQKGNVVDTLDGKEARLISSGISQYTNGGELPELNPEVEDILQADCILVIGADIDRTHPVAGNLIRRAVRENDAELIVINSQRDIFPLWTDLWLQPAADTERILVTGLAGMLMREDPKVTLKSELERMLGLYEPGIVAEKTSVSEIQIRNAVEMLSQAKNAYIICGSDLMDADNNDLVASLLTLTYLTQHGKGDYLKLLFLGQNVNSQGAWEMGAANQDVKSHEQSGVFLLLSDDNVDDDWAAWLKKADYLVVQASYHSPVVDVADVVLPSRIWAERGGSYITAGGRKVTSEPVLEPRYGLLTDEEVLERLEKKLNMELARK